MAGTLPTAPMYVAAVVAVAFAAVASVVAAFATVAFEAVASAVAASAVAVAFHSRASSPTAVADRRPDPAVDPVAGAADT